MKTILMLTLVALSTTTAWADDVNRHMELNENDLDRTMGELKNHDFQRYIISALSDELTDDEATMQSMLVDKLAAHNASTESDAHGTMKCNTCIRKSITYIVEESAKMLQSMCDKPPCVGIRYLCEALDSHPDLVVGFFMGHFRAFTLSLAYCAGAKLCDVPFDWHDVYANNEKCTPEERHCHSGAVLLGMLDMKIFEMSTDHGRDENPELSWDTMLQHIEGGMCADKEFLSSGKCDPCVGCEVAVMEFQLGRYVTKFWEMCDKTDIDSFQKVCHVVERRPELLAGYWIGHVKPYKTSSAFCMGKGLCKWDPHTFSSTKGTIEAFKLASKLMKTHSAESNKNADVSEVESET